MSGVYGIRRTSSPQKLRYQILGERWLLWRLGRAEGLSVAHPPRPPLHTAPVAREGLWSTEGVRVAVTLLACGGTTASMAASRDTWGHG